MMKNVAQALGGIVFCLGAAIQPVHAQSGQAMSSDQVKERYEAAKQRCDTLSGNQKDVCMKQAEADRTAARADSKAEKKTAEAQRDAQKDKRDADYKVAKEKCDALKGDAQDKCETDAKARFGK
ncbi:hypothetical protein PIGHUM_03117 [Pigmentiphaga humi]|uniref:Cell envelope biogenesis protein TolA n=1 Tax=Pigmentiphaga humi TaxID=2478468 RepID=A0A3P4B408_9BURK|nr:hypothetical protein [Pigmentiphaga humi]VCU71037.1 hypothetical protein PIGHUM_03117 [Pigmentiphaga humi]